MTFVCFPGGWDFIFPHLKSNQPGVLFNLQVARSFMDTVRKTRKTFRDVKRQQRKRQRDGEESDEELEDEMPDKEWQDRHRNGPQLFVEDGMARLCMFSWWQESNFGCESRIFCCHP